MARNAERLAPWANGLLFVYRYQSWGAAEQERVDFEMRGRHAVIRPTEHDDKRMFELWAEYAPHQMEGEYTPGAPLMLEPEGE